MLGFMHFETIDKKSDLEVLSALERFVGRERKRKAQFLVYLSVVDARKLYAKEGYSSLFKFLTEKFRFSESSALKRIQVSRLAHRFPFLYKRIVDGDFTLSALSRLAPFVNTHNSHLLFGEARGKSVREVEKILARWFPQEAVPDRLEKSVKDLSEDKVHVSFTAGREFEKDLLEAKALLSHKYPKGRLEEVLGLALKTLLKDLKKPNSKASHIPRGMSDCDSASDLSSCAPQQRPRFYRQVPKPSRYIPRGMRAAIRERDGAKCQYISPEGQVCGETHFLEIDHRRPFALGGPNTEENLRLLCRTHNVLAAEIVFGRMGRGT
jgi:5-methylcytosine-specific restriction endonuclease McrA